MYTYKENPQKRCQLTSLGVIENMILYSPSKDFNISPEEMKLLIENDMFKELQARNSLIGCPISWAGSTMETRSMIDLFNASHLIENVRWDGNKLLGDIIVLDTRAGKLLHHLLKEEDTILMCPRIVDFCGMLTMLITFDFTVENFTALRWRYNYYEDRVRGDFSPVAPKCDNIT